MSNKPCVFLIPTLLGSGTKERALPLYNDKILNELQDFVVENEKSARRFIKEVAPNKKQSELRISILNKHTADAEIPELLTPLINGNSIGILSEAGMPGIADPGAKLVKAAYAHNFKVIPLVGPSSIFLALAASGFNGQSFHFSGYLPIDKRERAQSIKKLESKSRESGSAEIFMETPYRNNKLLADLLHTLHPNTSLCIACDISLPTEFIYAGSVKKWQKKKVNLHKRPTIFIIQS